MIYVIGLTQFVILSLGLLGLTILAKVSSTAAEWTPLASFLTTSGLWLFAIPCSWIIFAHCIELFIEEKNAQRVIMASGVLVLLVIVGCFGTAMIKPVQ